MSILLIMIAGFSSIVAGMGIGGGSIFILLTTIFAVMEHRTAQGYNLIMFVVVGIVSTFIHIKNKDIDWKQLLKLIIPVCLGSYIGIQILKGVNEKTLQNYFYFFMIVIGLYEIITSIKNMLQKRKEKI